MGVKIRDSLINYIGDGCSAWGRDWTDGIDSGYLACDEDSISKRFKSKLLITLLQVIRYVLLVFIITIIFLVVFTKMPLSLTIQGRHLTTLL